MWADIKNWQHTYFRFQGRFNRARYWLHSVLAFAVTFFLQILAMYMFPIPDQLIMIFQSESLQKAIMFIVGAAPMVTFVYISTAISVKRLHDRDKSAWWALFYLGVPPIIMFGVVQGADATGQVTGWPAALIIPFLIMLVVTFIELGCLKGTTGPNQYGPDPVPAPKPLIPPVKPATTAGSGG
jgi:uncharacterized membrane protein YhaH (DUF805 family)